LEPGIDTGDIILQKTFSVEKNDDLNSLTRKANDLASKLIVEALEKFECDDYRAIPQVAVNRSYFSWPTPSQRKELNRRIKTLKA
jgi:methionyl-tRNA formyltransferase